MGQAKQRGSREERVEAAKTKSQTNKQNGYQILAEMVMLDLQSSGESIQRHLYNSLIDGETLTMTALGGAFFAYSNQPLNRLIGDEQAEKFFNTFGCCKSISMIDFEKSDIPFPLGIPCFIAPYDKNNICLL